MIDILNAFGNLIFSFFSNSNYVQVLGFLISLITSYQIAKHNTFKPRQLEIKEKQLNKIYLPLYRLLENIETNISVENSLYYFKKIEKTLNQNYLLAFPQLHVLTKKLKYEVSARKDVSQTLYSIKRQVEIDYELLKRALGYPSDNFYTIFKRMTPKQKLARIVIVFTTVSTLVPFPAFLLWFPLHFFNGDTKLQIIASMITLVPIAFLFYFLGTLERWARKYVN